MYTRFECLIAKCLFIEDNRELFVYKQTNID
jgi:hypothetical protein